MHTTQFRSFGKWVKTLCFLHPERHFCRTFRIWVLWNMCKCRHFCIFEIISEHLKRFWKVPQTVVRGDCYPSFFYFCFELLVNRSSFLVRFRHFALMLDLKMCLTSPAVAMWRTNWYQNWTRIQGRQEARNFPFCIKLSSLVWSTRAFDRWPTHVYIRVLRRVFQVIEMQACHRVFAPSRRDQDRQRILVLPRLFAIHRWPLPPLWWSWISAESLHFVWAQNLFAQLIHWCSRVNHEFSFLWRFWSGRWRCPGFSVRVKRGFIRTVELSDTFFAKSHATLRAQLSWCIGSSCVVYANLGAHGLRSCGSHFWVRKKTTEKDIKRRQTS